MINKKYIQYEAAISFLTVIILSILLSVITTGFVRLMTTYQRESTNEDLSNRAYYAAQAGFEDVVRLLKAKQIDTTKSKTDCMPYKIPYNAGEKVDSVSVANTTSGIDTAYTCSLIDLNIPTQSYDNLTANQAVVFYINPKDSLTKNFRIVIEWWSSPGIDGNLRTGTIISNDTRILPSASYWQQEKYPAMMRSTFIAFNHQDPGKYRFTSFYNTPDFKNDFTSETDADYINWRPQIFKGNGSNRGVTRTVNQNERPMSATNSSGGVQPVAECVVSAKRCKAVYDIENLEDNAQVFLILRPIYRPVDFVNVSIGKLDTADSKTSSPTTFAGGQAAIDITGRAGNVYRRIRQTVPYGTYPSGLLSDFPDFALVAGDGLCKQITVGSNASSFSPGECP